MATVKVTAAVAAYAREQGLLAAEEAAMSDKDLAQHLNKIEQAETLALLVKCYIYNAIDQARERKDKLLQPTINFTQWVNDNVVILNDTLFLHKGETYTNRVMYEVYLKAVDTSFTPAPSPYSQLLNS